MTKEELATLTADHKAFVEALKAQHTEELKTKDEEIESLKVEMAAFAKEDNRGIVVGEFKSDNGKTYGFKRGFTKVKINGETIESEDFFKKENASEMERLIEIGFGGLEVIKTAKK